MKKEVFPHYCPSAEYTGELFGVEYLYSQLGTVLTPSDSSIDAGSELADLDEGLGDEGLEDPLVFDDAEIAIALPECDDPEEVNNL